MINKNRGPEAVFLIKFVYIADKGQQWRSEAFNLFIKQIEAKSGDLRLFLINFVDTADKGQRRRSEAVDF
jgi:hypothetical protein